MVLWPLAYNDSGELVAASGADGGRDYRCSGDGCEARVRRRAGEQYEPHFYHAAETAGEGAGRCGVGEGALHAFVKRLVAAYILDGNYGWLSARTVCARGHAHRAKVGGVTALYMEHTVSGVRPDLFAATDIGAIAIEIVDTHDYDANRHAALFDGVLRIEATGRWTPGRITWTSYTGPCPGCAAEAGLLAGSARCAAGHRWSSAGANLPLDGALVGRAIDTPSGACPICERREGEGAANPGDGRCHWCARPALTRPVWGDRVCELCASGDFVGADAWIGRNGPCVVRERGVRCGRGVPWR